MAARAASRQPRSATRAAGELPQAEEEDLLEEEQVLAPVELARAELAVAEMKDIDFLEADQILSANARKVFL